MFSLKKNRTIKHAWESLGGGKLINFWVRITHNSPLEATFGDVVTQLTFLPQYLNGNLWKLFVILLLEKENKTLD